jgi:peptidoglycan hydrolase-like protein with peptidoglycan-binding domain
LNPAAVLNRLEADHLGTGDLRTLQTRLKLKGFNPGPIDGKEGKRTLAALNRYRQSIHLPRVDAINRDTTGGLLDQ